MSVCKLAQHQLAQLEQYRSEMLRHITDQRHFLLKVAQHPAAHSRISFNETPSISKKDSLADLCVQHTDDVLSEDPHGVASDVSSEAPVSGRSTRLSDWRAPYTPEPKSDGDRARTCASLFDGVGLLPVHEMSYITSGGRKWQLWTPHGHAVLARMLVNNIFFQMFLCVLILMYTVFVGIRSNHCANASFAKVSEKSDARMTIATPHWMQIAELLFNVAFAAELLLRVYVLRSRFLSLHDRRWNMFDVFAVAMSFAEYPARVLTSLTISVLVRRAGRAAQTLRILRFAPMIHGLRFLTLAFLSSIQPLAWAAVLFAFVLFSFAVVLQDAVAEYVLVASAYDTNVSDLQVYFSSLPMCLLTLFMSIFGGIDWFPVVRLLLNVGTFYGAFFLLFVLLTSMSLMNILTGVFVKDSMERGETETSRRHLAKLTTLFRRLDTQKSGVITLAQLEEAMKIPQVIALFATLDIDATDAMNFFHLLDTADQNQVDTYRFLTGCVRMRGKTGLLELEVSMLELRSQLERLTDMEESTEQRIRQLTGKLTDILRRPLHDPSAASSPRVKLCASEVELVDLFADVTVAEIRECAQMKGSFTEGLKDTNDIPEVENTEEQMLGEFVLCWETGEEKQLCPEEGATIASCMRDEIFCLFGESDLDSSASDLSAV